MMCLGVNVEGLEAYRESFGYCATQSRKYSSFDQKYYWVELDY